MKSQTQLAQMTSVAALGASDEGLEKAEALIKARAIQACQLTTTVASAEAAAEQWVQTLVAHNDKTFEEIKEML